ncbi:hypothetical protein FHS15_005049 [Paenibacillus castaneae]|uniref:hypothetical protein n=1 Tax=Paenibacillus castaneae TaxID=474957 RepID=UPI000C9A9F46|nr:hypothetical protein [Paenibacillus castaneae]NIK79882.1 hypothetical protein [Paenibacillus castaneae]
MHDKGLKQRNAWHLKWMPLLLLCLFALIAGGCGSSKDEHTRTYGHDGYMGYSNSNPNLPGRHMALNYESDGNMVNTVLKPLSGIERTQVYFNGTTMYVTLKVNKNLSAAQVKELRTKAENIVQHNMQRYKVHVKTKK